MSLPNSHELRNLDKLFLVENIGRNTTAYLNVQGDKVEHIGNRTECAMLNMVRQWNIDYKEYRDNEKELLQIGFSSQRKSMTTVYTELNSAKVYCKGAPEIVLSSCDYFLDANSHTCAMNEKKME